MLSWDDAENHIAKTLNILWIKQLSSITSISVNVCALWMWTLANLFKLAACLRVTGHDTGVMCDVFPPNFSLAAWVSAGAGRVMQAEWNFGESRVPGSGSLSRPGHMFGWSGGFTWDANGFFENENASRNEQSEMKWITALSSYKWREIFLWINRMSIILTHTTMKKCLAKTSDMQSSLS